MLLLAFLSNPPNFACTVPLQPQHSQNGDVVWAFVNIVTMALASAVYHAAAKSPAWLSSFPFLLIHEHSAAD
jgi:hypothetical protein